MSGGTVLVVGDNDLAGLASVRSLGRAGHRVHLVAFESSPITRRSRYVEHIHHLGHPLTSPETFAQRVLELAARHRFDLILPTSDKALIPLVPHRDVFDRLSRFGGPTQSGFAITQCKHRTLELAHRTGVPVPRSLLLSHPDEIAGLLAPESFPTVLKPIHSMQAGSLSRNEVVVVRTPREFEPRLRALLERCPVLVQEFCPGHGVGLCVLASEGELIAAFQHERVHEPPDGGASTYRRSVPLSPVLLDMARRLCRDLRWEGPAMIEFKVDPETGASVLMEINGRLWGSLPLAIRAGVDFPRLLYDQLVRGRATPTFFYRTPCYARHTTRDVFWLRSNFRTPTGRNDLLRRGTGEVLGECRQLLLGQEGWDVEALDDPFPGVLAWLQLGREVVGGAQRGLNRLRFRWSAGARLRQWTQDPARFLPALRSARSILVLCTGNIHRSAVAEHRLRTHLPQEQYRIESGGLLQRPGRPTSDVSASTAQALGIDLSDHRSRGLTRQQVQQAELILAMEVDHLSGLARLDPACLEKTWLLGTFHPRFPRLEIPDPDGQGARTFHEVYRTILDCTDALVARLQTP